MTSEENHVSKYRSLKNTVIFPGDRKSVVESGLTKNCFRSLQVQIDEFLDVLIFLLEDVKK